MGYDQYTCSWHCSCRTYFCCFPLALANIRPWNFLPFFEKQWTKNHPQYLSRLSRALFSTTFLETAVYGTWRLAQCSHTSFGFSYPTTTGASWKPASLVCEDERMRAQTMKPCLTFVLKGVKIDFYIQFHSHCLLGVKASSVISTSFSEICYFYWLQFTTMLLLFVNFRLQYNRVGE